MTQQYSFLKVALFVATLAVAVLSKSDLHCSSTSVERNVVVNLENDQAGEIAIYNVKIWNEDNLGDDKYIPLVMMHGSFVSRYQMENVFGEALYDSVCLVYDNIAGRNPSDIHLLLGGFWFF